MELPQFSSKAQDSSWEAFAHCRSTDPELFFAPGQKMSRTQEKDAKKVCAECVVRSECLEAALDCDEEFGIWGGLTEQERRKLKRNVGRNALR